ncbi:hypothetical protein HDU97_005775, partial [Phlyctochytrium planicorne]
VDFATTFKALGDDILVNGHWISDPTTGIKWLLLLSIPSNDFLSVIRITFRNAIIFIVVFCVASLIIAGLLSWYLTAPLAKLAQSMVAATGFDFSDLKDGYLERRSFITEIGRLQGVFEEMLRKFATAIKSNKGLMQAKGLSSGPQSQSQGQQSTGINSSAPGQK